MVEIVGDRTAIRDAIVALSSYAQGDSQYPDSSVPLINRPQGAIGEEINIIDETAVRARASQCERVPQVTGEQVVFINPLSDTNDKLHDNAFSSQSTKYDDANSTSSDSAESTPSRQKPANASNVVKKSVSGTVITGVQNPANEAFIRMWSSCFAITPSLPFDIIGMIARRLPPESVIPSVGWLRVLQSMPRPTLLLPRHANDDWQMLLPTTVKLSDDTLAKSTLDGGQQLTHTIKSATRNLGIPAGAQPTRLIGGHPSHPIFMQGQMCFVCSVATGKVYHHPLSIPGRGEEGDKVLKGAISHTLVSTEGEPAKDSMLLLATYSSIFGRLVKDMIRPWAVGSLGGKLQGATTDILFADGEWYLMDDTRHLYRVYFCDFSLLVQEIEVEMIPAQIFKNVICHWIFQWPGGSIACICLQNRPHLAAGEACYTTYLLQKGNGKMSSWQKLHNLHDNTVFLSSGKTQPFALKDAQRWGLKQDVIYHTDLTDYDLVWRNFPNGLLSVEAQWPFPLWLLCSHL